MKINSYDEFEKIGFAQALVEVLSKSDKVDFSALSILRPDLVKIAKNDECRTAAFGEFIDWGSGLIKKRNIIGIIPKLFLIWKKATRNYRPCYYVYVYYNGKEVLRFGGNAHYTERGIVYGDEIYCDDEIECEFFSKDTEWLGFFVKVCNVAKEKLAAFLKADALSEGNNESEQICGDQSCEVFRRKISKGLFAKYPCVVDQHVNLPVFIKNTLYPA